MLHIVLYMSNKDEIAERLGGLNYPKWEVDDSAVIVSCKKTAEELALELGIGIDDQRGFVSAIENYSGFASKNFVEWFRLHKE